MNYSEEWFYAIRNNDIDKVREMLDSGIADVDCVDSKGNTGLMYASWNGDVSLLRLLLNERADPNIKNNEGETALNSNYNESVLVLMESGADPNVMTSRGDESDSKNSPRGVGVSLLSW